MKLHSSLGAAVIFYNLANAQNIPSQVTILTPRQDKSVGILGAGWMIDVVAEFSAPASAAATTGSTASSTTAAAAAAATTSASNGGGFSYRKSKRSTKDDGFFPFLNSPGLSTFGPGTAVAAPSLVCLVSTASDPTQNFAGAFQAISITNSDAQGNILEAYFTWYIGAAGFGSNVNSTTTVFFLNDTAPAKYTKDPKTDPSVISNVASVDYFIFGDEPSNKTSASSTKTPVTITLFTPRDGESVGINGAGWLVDMALSSSDSNSNVFAPTKGYDPIYRDNTTHNGFAPGVNPAIPGLVVTSNTSTLPGGESTNLAGLFQLNAATGIQDSIVNEYWSTWLVGSAFAGTNQPSSLTIYLVNGTAPATINGTKPSNIISNTVTVNFNLAGNASASGTLANSGTPTSSSVPKTSKGAANTLSMGVGALFAGAFAFLL
ncbi:hypothetical protein ACHAQJ_000490 [Trichoderma viride]